MNCREAKAEIALLVGNDLKDAGARESLRRHVSACPECRGHYQRLKQTFRVLEQADKTETFEVRESLWPALSTRLRHRQQEQKPSRRQWWPLASFLAACLVVVAIVNTPAPQHPHAPAVDRGMMSELFPVSSDVSPEPLPDRPETTADDSDASVEKQHKPKPDQTHPGR